MCFNLHCHIACETQSFSGTSDKIEMLKYKKALEFSNCVDKLLLKCTLNCTMIKCILPYYNIIQTIMYWMAQYCSYYYCISCSSLMWTINGLDLVKLSYARPFHPICALFVLESILHGNLCDIQFVYPGTHFTHNHHQLIHNYYQEKVKIPFISIKFGILFFSWW